MLTVYGCPGSGGSRRERYAQCAPQAARPRRRHVHGAAVVGGLHPALRDGRGEHGLAEGSTQVGAALGYVEAVEGEPAPPSLERLDVDSDRSEHARGLRAELDRAVRLRLDRVALCESVVQRDPKATGEVVVAAARRAELALAPLGRRRNPAGEAVE